MSVSNEHWENTTLQTRECFIFLVSRSSLMLSANTRMWKEILWPVTKGGKESIRGWVSAARRKDASFRSVFFFFEMRFCCWCTHTRAQIQTPINWDWSPACPCFLEFSPNELPWGERSSFLPVCHIQFIHPLSCFNPVNTCRPFLSFRFCAKENICWWHHFEERLNDF